MVRMRTHVPGNRKRLAFVALDVRRRSRAVNWIEHVEELCCLVSASHLRDRHDHPHRRMGVLPTIFADSGRVPLDVARVVDGAVERRREEGENSRGPTQQVGTHRIHRLLGIAARTGAREHRPRLSNRVDFAFIALGRPER